MRPNTWLHRPACKREENPCQLGAVHTWHIATLRCDAQIRSLLEALRTCHERHERSGATRLTRSGHRQDRNAAAQRSAAVPYGVLTFGRTEAEHPDPIQNISGLTQGPAGLNHGRLRVPQTERESL